MRRRQRRSEIKEQRPPANYHNYSWEGELNKIIRQSFVSFSDRFFVALCFWGGGGGGGNRHESQAALGRGSGSNGRPLSLRVFRRAVVHAQTYA